MDEKKIIIDTIKSESGLRDVVYINIMMMLVFKENRIKR